MNRLAAVLAALSGACIIWGALAFGAVYPWAFTPLAVACALVGATALIAVRPLRPPLFPVALAFGAVAAAILIQMAPLPGALVDRLSPHSDAFAEQATAALADSGTAVPETSRQLSIAPARTVVGLGLFVAFALFALGAARVSSAVGGRRLATIVVFFGMLLAVIGVAQHTLTGNEENPLIYGFWKPQPGARPFGPFVNPNHFAGWMLMATSLALGLFLDVFQMSVAFVEERRGNRRSLVGTPYFGATVLFGGAYLIMGLSLITTRSRSGIASFAAAGALAGIVALRRQASRWARIALAGGFALLVCGAIAWAGLDTTMAKFVQGDRGRASAGARLSAWGDTIRIVRDYPVAGTGLNTFGAAMELYQTERAIHFQEAHNDYLQLAAEGGMLLGVPIVVAILIFIQTVRRRFRESPKHGSTYWLRVGAIVGIVAVALQSFVELSLQMPGNAALFALLAGIAIHQSPNLRTARPSA